MCPVWPRLLHRLLLFPGVCSCLIWFDKPALLTTGSGTKALEFGCHLILLQILLWTWLRLKWHQPLPWLLVHRQVCGPLTLFSGGTSYTIDVVGLTQTNDKTKFQRKIRKTPHLTPVGNTASTASTTPSIGGVLPQAIFAPKSAGYVAPANIVLPSAIPISGKPMVNPITPTSASSGSDDGANFMKVTWLMPVGSGSAGSSTNGNVGYSWEFSDLKGGWTPYDSTAQGILETAWRAGQASATYVFFFSFQRMLTPFEDSLTVFLDRQGISSLFLPVEKTVHKWTSKRVINGVCEEIHQL